MGSQLLVSLLKSNAMFFDIGFIGHKQWLHDQLGRMRKIRTRSTAESGDIHIITGKTHAHKIVDCQDDQAISMLIALYVSHQWIDRVKMNSQRVR